MSVQPSQRKQLHDMAFRTGRNDEFPEIERIQKHSEEVERYPSSQLAELERLRSKVEELERNYYHTNRASSILPLKCDDCNDCNDCNDCDDYDHNDEDIDVDVDVDNQGYQTAMLPGDTYSCMIVSKPLSIPFLQGIFVFLLQMGIYFLLINDSVNPDDPRNPFNIPVNVNFAVRCTQVFAMIIGSVSQKSMRTALILMGEGYQQGIPTSFPDSSCWRFYLAVMLRFLEGTCAVLVSIALIVTASDVLELLLNFTALQFASLFSDVIHQISFTGFAGRQNKRVAETIINTEYLVEPRRLWFPKPTAPVIIFLNMIGLWVWVVYLQSSGAFTCSTIYVQFGDDFRPELEAFSGIYRLRSIRGNPFDPKRPYYVEEKSQTAFLAYCQTLGAWTLSISANRTLDPCNYVAKSATSASFAFSATGHLPWFTLTHDRREISMGFVHFQCLDCDLQRKNSQTGDVCSGRGYCADAACYCNEGWGGLRCEFPAPCPTIQFDTRHGSFPRFSHLRAWSTTYNILQPNGFDELIQSYNRPIYFSEYEDGLFDLIFFTGKRWVATFTDAMPFPPTNDREVAEFFRDQFHAYWSNYTTAFMSSPMFMGTPEDSLTPVGKNWFRAQLQTNAQDHDMQKIDPSAKVQATFLCTVCNNDNPCFFDGQCVMGSCNCSIGSSGALCQIPPIGNGRCDKFYDKGQFFFDGGDCCEYTCVSSNEHQCGKTESKFVYKGYPECELERITRDEWVLASNPINGESMLALTVALSGNGRFMAVGEPDQDRVNLYDRDGSMWIQRDPRQNLRGTDGSQFGIAIAVSRGNLHMVNNPMSIIPMVIAVGESSGFLSVFECNIKGCLQIDSMLETPKGDDSAHDVSLDLSADGNVVAISKRSSSVVVFELYNSREWIERLLSLTTEAVYAVSLSGNGDLLAIGWVSNDDGSDTKQTYLWDGNVWNVYGNPIVYTSSSMTGKVVERVAQSIALSEDGNVLAVGKTASYDGQPGVEVYTWENMDWVQRGDTLVCDHALGGWPVAVSSDGSFVAVGAGRDGGDNMVHTFFWNGTDWLQQGNAIESGGHTCEIALSSDGFYLAVGGITDLYNGNGQVTAYTRYRERCAGATRSRLHVSVTTDEFGEDTVWDLIDSHSGELLLEGGPYDGYINSTFASSVCVEANECSVFTIYDKVGLEFARMKEEPNGWNPPANYALFLDEKQVANSILTDSFEKIERVYVGNCQSCRRGTRLFRMFVRTCVPLYWELLDKDGNELFTGDSFDDFDLENVDYDCMNDAKEFNYWKEFCLPVNDCGTFSLHAPSSNSLVKPFSGSGTIDNTGDDEGRVVNASAFLPVENANFLYRLFLDTTKVASGTSSLVPDEVTPLITVQVGKC